MVLSRHIDCTISLRQNKHEKKKAVARYGEIYKYQAADDIQKGQKNMGKGWSKCATNALERSGKRSSNRLSRETTNV